MLQHGKLWQSPWPGPNRAAVQLEGVNGAPLVLRELIASLFEVNGANWNPMHT